MARSGGLFTPFGPSSQAPTLFRFALLEPEEVLIISVALTNLLINEMGGENILLRGRFLKWRAREGGWTLGRPALAPSGADAVLIAPGNQPNLSEVLVHPERNSAFE